MEGYEREFLVDTLAHLSASMGQALRDGFDAESILDGREQLSDRGSMWVQGYLLGHLAVIRGCSSGNPNLSPDDIADVGELVDEHQSRIAGEVYS